jgi:membrane protease YdiL (CAAX protease family)
MTFQQTAAILTVIWLVLVAARFRRSKLVLIGGLVGLGLYTFAELADGAVRLDDLGLGVPSSWLPTVGFALAWLGLMLAYSPVADRLATRWVDKPPTLEAFRALQESRGKLIAGIAVAWLLGGILEELIFRGILLRSAESVASAGLGRPVATAVAVCIAALGAGLIHFYQGPRAVLIVTQLSVLFGVLFVVTGYDLWAVMLCHGLYDTIAFVRFAKKKSRYAEPGGEEARSRRPSSR